jgi:hypothetical protein
MMPEFTAAQRAAFSFVALAKGDPQWRTINRRRLSFTDLDWSPLGQLYGTIAAGLSRLIILPGDPAGLGFAALNDQDAEQLRLVWVILLTPDGAGTGGNPSPPPAARRLP